MGMITQYSSYCQDNVQECEATNSRDPNMTISTD